MQFKAINTGPSFKQTKTQPKQQQNSEKETIDKEPASKIDFLKEELAKLEQNLIQSHVDTTLTRIDLDQMNQTLKEQFSTQDEFKFPTLPQPVLQDIEVIDSKQETELKQSELKIDVQKKLNNSFAIQKKHNEFQITTQQDKFQKKQKPKPTQSKQIDPDMNMSLSGRSIVQQIPKEQTQKMITQTQTQSKIESKPFSAPPVERTVSSQELHLSKVRQMQMMFLLFRQERQERAKFSKEIIMDVLQEINNKCNQIQQQGAVKQQYEEVQPLINAINKQLLEQTEKFHQLPHDMLKDKILNYFDLNQYFNVQMMSGYEIGNEREVIKALNECLELVTKLNQGHQIEKSGESDIEGLQELCQRVQNSQYELCSLMHK